MYVRNDLLTENNKIILDIFQDFKRAFEKLYRTLLLKKLNKIDFSQTVLNFFENNKQMSKNQI